MLSIETWQNYFFSAGRKNETPFVDETKWSLWKECSVTCGGGTQKREKKTCNPIITFLCPTKEESKPCNTNSCRKFTVLT